jgi:integrase
MPKLPEKNGKLTEKNVGKLQAPAEGYALYWDTEVKGFGVRVTAAESKSFIFQYRTRGGTPRRLTIGSPPTYSVEAARRVAKRHSLAVDQGGDPYADWKGERDAPTFADLSRHYLEKHAPKKRTGEADRFTIDRVLLPKFKNRKVAEITFVDIDGLHHKLSKDHPYMANRIVSLLSKMFSLAIKKQWRTDNPAKGIERNEETPRERYLSPPELERLTKTLGVWPDQEVADIIRLLLYTGARRGEVLAAEWKQFNLDEGTWTKPSSHTKTKRVHKVPLSDEALAVLSKMQAERAKADKVSPFLFPGRSEGHKVDLKKPWPAICKAAHIEGLRIHDLRHSFASILVAGGASLPMIGRLLGHTQVATTQRYAHLDVEPLRKLVATVGAVVDGAAKAPKTVVPLKGK